MHHTYNTKKDALRTLISCAKDYHETLENTNFLFLYRNRATNLIEYFETVFLPRNFQHLTGVDYLHVDGTIQKNSVEFYRKCLDNKLTEYNIRFRPDGTTSLKLEALPKLIDFLQSSKITIIYNGGRPALSVDRLVGTTNYCLGFTHNGRYFVPSSCLLEDIRKFGSHPSQILAILSKPANKSFPIYMDVRYVAKGVNFHSLILPDSLQQLIIQK